MNILIIGSGGREHTYACKIASSPRCTSLFVAPGNAGTAKIATNLPISVSDFAAIETAVITHSIDLVVVGPEEPLVKGIVDYFKSKPTLQDILIVGPDASGARLEGSKDFSKDFMVKYGIPTASSATFTASTLEAGLDYLDTYSGPYVLKADGLAAGKGVIITESRDDAKTQLTEMLLDKKFGQASEKVLIEQFLTGIELSVFVLTDGKNYLILPEAKDYKRIGEGDTGLNTGGMGAVSPVPFATRDFMDKVENQVILKVSDNGLGIDMKNEKGGSIPSSVLYDKKYGEGRWKYSTIYSLSIGQGEMLVTPLQMANLAAIFANKGYYYPPHMIKAIDGDPNKIPEEFRTRKDVGVDAHHFDLIQDAMAEAIYGTAARAAMKEITLAGKTGTAQNPHGEDHSVFIAFAPKEDPKIAIAVYVENAGWGGRAAASTASLMIEKYLRGQVTRPALEEYVLAGNFIY